MNCIADAGYDNPEQPDPVYPPPPRSQAMPQDSEMTGLLLPLLRQDAIPFGRGPCSPLINQTVLAEFIGKITGDP